MKRILSIILVLLCIMLTACAKDSSVEVIGGADTPAGVLVADETEEETEEVKEVNEEINKDEEEQELTEDGRPVVYWANPSLRDSSDVAYHRKDCEIIKDLKPDKLPWALIEALKMEPCTKCNPDK